MAILKSEAVPKNSGAAFDLKKCQRLKIAEKSIVDFVAFNLRDLTEAFDQGRWLGQSTYETYRVN